ncbi:MAG: hypothetical protein Fur0018_06210 [Anaerolineales bacterium]
MKFSHRFSPLYRIVLLLTFVLPWGLPVPARAQAAPRILESSTENHFPDGLTFHIVAEADAPIEKIFLFYRQQGDIGTTRQALNFEPGTHVEAAYTWDTSRFTVPPSAPVLFSWEVRDADGSVTKSEETRFYYHDVRFAWQELQDDDLVVRWYEGDAAFGQLLFDTARTALDRMVRESGSTLEFPVYLVVYPNRDDFASWHAYVEDWVGGEAYPSLGVTVELISPADDVSWIMDVIPHEIAHLFFYQAVHAAFADWPHWLDEGVAQYYEPGSHTPELAQVSAAAKEGRLIGLDLLSGSFGSDDARVRLAYAESLSAVTYMRTAWGDEAFSALIAAIRGGKPFRDAVQDAFGVTWEEFVAGWWNWMGVSVTPAAPPTATATMAFPTAPSWELPTPLATITPLLPSPTIAAPAPSQTPAVEPVSTQADFPTRSGLSLLAGCMAAAGVIAFLGWLMWRSGRTTGR